jgi:hypothetical protein
MGKDVEGRGRGLTEMLSENLPGGTEENRETPQSVIEGILAEIRGVCGVLPVRRYRLLEFSDPNLGLDINDPDWYFFCDSSCKFCDSSSNRL